MINKTNFYMKKIALLTLLLVPLALSAQKKYSKEEIVEITDSILAEGNLLYQYERAAWMSTDLAHADKQVARLFKSYLIYQDGDTIKGIIINSGDIVVATYLFYQDFTKEYSSDLTRRDLSDKESKLLTARNEILNNLNKYKYPVTCPDGFSLNMILIPYNDGYKFYIITGTSQNGVIPFGNDYIFFAGSDYAIKDWRKFHSGLIPVESNSGENAIISSVHSHLKKEPFISATDICTFKLYASYVGLNSFSVYSPALSLYFRYSLASDSIETSRKMFD